MVASMKEMFDKRFTENSDPRNVNETEAGDSS
jgi:hypothetical protein